VPLLLRLPGCRDYLCTSLIDGIKSIVANNRFDAIDKRFDTIDNHIQSVREEFTILLANSHAALDAPWSMGFFGHS
jgi:hypothetical protein